ncbi:MAG: hypothetical protein WCL32_24240 [Planctomycetota bacterium]
MGRHLGVRSREERLDEDGLRRAHHDGCLECAYDPLNNVVVFANIRSRIAYRYKK